MKRSFRIFSVLGGFALLVIVCAAYPKPVHALYSAPCFNFNVDIANKKGTMAEFNATDGNIIVPGGNANQPAILQYAGNVSIDAARPECQGVEFRFRTIFLRSNTAGTSGDGMELDASADFTKTGGTYPPNGPWGTTYDTQKHNCGRLLAQGGWTAFRNGQNLGGVVGGDGGAGFYIVLNYGKDCAGGSGGGSGLKPKGPPGPAILVARCAGADNKQVYGQWQIPVDATKNIVQRSLNGSAFTTMGGEESAPFFSYFLIDKPVPANATLVYRIQSKDNVFSNTATFTTDAQGVCKSAETKAVLTGVCTDGGLPLNLAWTQAVNANENILVKRIDGGSPTNLVDEGQAPFTKYLYSDSQLSPGKTYTYLVKTDPNIVSNTITASVNSAGACTVSGNPSGSVGPTPLGTPVPADLLSATCAMAPSPQVNLHWQKVTSATSNILNRTVDADPTFSLIFQEAAKPFTRFDFADAQPFVMAGHTYQYQIQYDIFNKSNIVTVAFPSAGSTGACTVTSGGTTPPPTPGNAALNLSKIVRNATKGVAENDIIVASPNDVLEFAIHVGSAGGATVQNVRLIDTLPAGLAYLPGSTTIDGLATADGIAGSGLSLGNLPAGRSVNVRFRVTVAAESFFNIGSTALTNTAAVSSGNTPTIQDTAFVNVTRTQAVITGGNLSLIKFGRNLSRRESAELPSVTANPGETLEFIVHVKSNSTSIVNDVVVSDTLPIGLSYVPGSTSVNGVATGDDVVNGQGLNVGSINANDEKIIRFSARVNTAGSFSIGINSLINTARAQTTDVVPIIGQLPISVFRSGVAGVSQVSTGPVESVAIAGIGALIITLLYVGYTKLAGGQTSQAFEFLRHREGLLDFRAGVVAAILIMAAIQVATSYINVTYQGSGAAEQAPVPAGNQQCFIDSHTGGPTCFYTNK